MSRSRFFSVFMSVVLFFCLARFTEQHYIDVILEKILCVELLSAKQQPEDGVLQVFEWAAGGEGRENCSLNKLRLIF